MLDINQYTYTKDPFTKSKAFEVHPLNDKGFKEYCQRDAHTHTYLSRLNPRILQQLDDYMETNNRRIPNSVRDEKQPEIQEECYDSEKIRNMNQLKTENNYYNEDYFEKLNKDSRAKTARVKFGSSNSFYNGNYKNTYSNPFHSKSNSQQHLDEKLAIFGSNSFMKKVKTNIKPKKSKSNSRFNSEYINQLNEKNCILY